MLDILKKRFKVNDSITIRTAEGSFTGRIESFEDNCLILVTFDGTEEFIAADAIKGASVPIISGQLKNDESLSTKQEEQGLNDNTKIDFESIGEETTIVNTGEIKQIERADEALNKNESPLINKDDEESHKKIGIKILGKIDLDKVDPRRKTYVSANKAYRLGKLARELDLGITEIANKLNNLGFKVDANPYSKIGQPEYAKLMELIEKDESIIKTKKEGKTDLLGIRLNSLEQLTQIKERIDIEEKDQILPANATIKRYGNLGFGYVNDQNNRDYYFRYTDVKDNELLKRLKKHVSLEGTQVICTLNNNFGRFTATEIYLPHKVDFFLELAKKYYNQDEHNKALIILELILTTYPDLVVAKELQNKIGHSHILNTQSIQNQTDFYLLAKTALKNGDSDKAKELFEQSILLDEKRSESAIKELSYLLQKEGEFDKAINIVIKYSKKIKTSDPNSLIAYFYETKKDFKKAIEYLNKVKSITLNEQIRLSKRKAICFWGLSDYENAEKEILFVLKEKPEDAVSLKLFDGLKIARSGGTTEELEAIFNEAQLSTLTGGQSPYIRFSLDHCTYSGLPKEIRVGEKYDLNALKSIRNYIEKAAGNRPIEKAEFLLTEARLMEQITPEKELELNAVLSRRSMALAEASALNGKPSDVLRFFLLESFRLAPSFDFVVNHVPIYFASFNSSSPVALNSYQKVWRESIKQTFKTTNEQEFWYGIMDILISNPNISNSIMTFLFKEFRQQCYKFLNENQERQSDKELKDRFIKSWNDKTNSFKNSKNSFSIKLDSLSGSKTSESFAENFNKTISPIPDWVCQTDINRINILNEIIKSISEFNNQSSFEDKERYYNIILNQILQARVEIEESPTELSFNILRKLLQKIESIINSEFNQLIETSKPEISLSILGEGVLHEADLLVNIQVSVANKKGSAPVSWLSLEIENTEDITFISVNNILDQTLKGGEEKIIRLQVKVNQKVKDEGATNVKILCSYKIRGSEEANKFLENLSLRLYSEAEFIKIDNCFAATADSGPVTDPNMFFGRDSFIENINNSILDSKSKCIIIYGQKRSGKSSVLYHLKERLLQDSNSFCISFSLGEIVEDLSSLTFYYKILSEIEDELGVLAETGIRIPDFLAPSLSELKEAPSLIFNECLKKFNKEISLLNEWDDKKLILLLDEFTYIYTAIQKEVLSDDFMKTWKSFLEKGYFTSVLVGQDIMPKFTEAYPNEFGVTESKRLSYLDKDDAIKLIEIPIWDNLKNRSRFLGNAVTHILDYTSSNPYYIQIFCARLVDYMNHKKFISVTEADVIEVAQSLIKGEQSLSADKFDNLITAGDSDLEAFSPKDILKALKEIAIASKNLDSCNRDAINLGDKEYEEKILKDLKTREVISSPTTNYYKINVRLFKEWLLIN